MKLKTLKPTSVNLDENSRKILRKFQEEVDFSRSVIFRKLLSFFDKNPEELKKILIAEIGLEVNGENE